MHNMQMHSHKLYYLDMDQRYKIIIYSMYHVHVFTMYVTNITTFLLRVCVCVYLCLRRGYTRVL